MMREDSAMDRARTRAKDVRDFYYHLMVFVLVNLMLIAIDLSGGAGVGIFGLDFAQWVIFGWGFGIVGHAISVFLGDWRVQKYYEEEKRRELV
jgi:hypothetical protein